MPNKAITGIKRHPKKFILAICFGYSVLWGFLEPILAILDIKPSGLNYYYLGVYLLISLLIAIIYVWPRSNVSFNLKNTNTKVEIQFGDLFQSSGHKAIPVNEYFDSQIGKPVSPNSLHGIFINNILGGHSNILDDSVAKQLVGKEIATSSRPEGKNKKYPIGTTITIPYNNSLYFLFALCNSDNDCKATSNPSLMLKAMEGFWDIVRTEGNGFDINLPLIGNGLSGIGLPPSQLLQLILISLLKFTKERELSCTVRIVLLQDIFESIDLELIKNNWQ